MSAGGWEGVTEEGPGVGEYEEDGVWRVAVHACAGAIIEEFLACVRNGGIHNNVKACTSKGKWTRLVV
jgi:hypothetical protein